MLADLQRPRRDGFMARPGFQHAGLAGILLILVTVPGLVVAEAWLNERSMRRDWAVEGPACPVVDRPSRSAVGSKPPKPFDYNGVRYVRHLGHVSCVAFREDGFFKTGSYQVCQFSGPGAVSVIRDGRKVTFQPGVGKRATVTVRGAQISCVAAGWFHY